MSTKRSTKGVDLLRKWLKTIRENKGMSQDEVAKDVKVSRQYYNFIENGDRRPSPEVAKKIATVLGFKNEWYKLLEPPESA